ncbi:uncharacterized protein LOC117641506 [Thrips palmi]|uniref:Uncharacterized protein LOC117641506 n=1 Tax=Thrips palmi TaxID=161013 RepID=A0A6P8Y5C3_THRPL|nr:uncharacterized protein LOC117641506 [Thrips palmi]
MDESLLQQNRDLHEVLSNIRSLINEVAAMQETSYDLQLSMAVSLSPDVMSGVREAVAVMKEAEAQLSSHCNNLSTEAAEVKIDWIESGGDGTSGNVVTLSPDCTVYVNDD